MGTIVVFIVVFLSAQFGGQVAAFKTEAECREFRASAEKNIAEVAPQIGDAVYLGPCQRVVLKPVPGGKDA